MQTAYCAHRRLVEPQQAWLAMVIENHYAVNHFGVNTQRAEERAALGSATCRGPLIQHLVAMDHTCSSYVSTRFKGMKT
jgi:hypothetical protein